MTQSVKSQKLKVLLDSMKKPSVLTAEVEKYLLNRPSTRATDVLHPSEIVRADWCIRRSWFLLDGVRPKRESHTLRTESIFENGHQAHTKWQTWLAEMDALLGKWVCLRHGETWWGRRMEQHVGCPVEYLELSVTNGDQTYPPIRGHADGWVVLPKDKGEYLLEVKTVGIGTINSNGGYLDPGGLAKSFKGINRPYTDHVRQAMLYLFLLKGMFKRDEIPFAPPKEILFLYECKEDQAVKEYTVKYDVDFLQPVFDKIEVLHSYGDEPPPCSFREDYLNTNGTPYCPKCREFS